MVHYKNTITPSGIKKVEITGEELTKLEADITEWNDASADRKLTQIKEIRLQKLIETDYLANSDVTMPDNIKTWRQSLRNLPQDFSSEEQYDLLLARETDDTKDNFGQLTHNVWSKP
tara:strand:+ start:510 stop:860 length:351 start_codon:yes stop_codon:yes gene_type:complete